MVFRFIFRYLSNNEKLIERLSESYPIRRAAQITVEFMNRGKQITETETVKNISKFDLKSFLQRFSKNVKEEIQDAKDKFKK